MRHDTGHFLRILGLIAVLLASPVRGEEDFNSFINEGLPPPADISPTFNPPPPPPQDRKSGSGAAVAMAIVGAAMAGASCAMLLRQAAQEQDPSKKAMLRAMAMQQCAQAAQNAANAAKNNEGKEQITSNGPQQAQLDALPTLAKGESKGEDRGAVPNTGSSTEESTTDPEQVVDADNFIEPDFDAFEPDFAFDSGIPDDLGAGVDDGIATLNPIDKANVTFDDDSKGDQPTPQVPLGASTSQYSFAGAQPGSLKNNASKDGLEYDDNAKKRGRGKLDELLALASGGDVSSSGSGSSESSFNLSKMMGELMGKNDAPGGRVFGSGPQVVNLPGGKDGEKNPNIFEYASFRYRQSARDGLLIKRVRKIKSRPKNVAVAGKPLR